MAMLKVGNPSMGDYPQQQEEQMTVPSESIILYPHEKTEIETPFGKLSYGDWFGVASICIIILVVGIVKKYFWNTTKKPNKK